MTRKVWLSALIGLLAVGCGDDSTTQTSDTDNNTGGGMTTGVPMTTTGETPTTMTTEAMTGSATDDPSSSGEPPVVGVPRSFTVTIENISDTSVLPTPFSPGVYVEHLLGSTPMFQANMAAPVGLEALAEDGDPTELDTSLEVLGGVVSNGVFNTPVGADAPAAILPGESYSLEFEAQPGSRLSLATMLVASNDVFVGTSPNGVGLFNNAGNEALPERDISDLMAFWDAGTEANQPFGGGIYQASAGGGPDFGPAESGVVSVRDEATRQLPNVKRMLRVEVVVDAEAGTVLLDFFNTTNESPQTSEENLAITSPFAGFVWAQHPADFEMVTAGAAASGMAGLEELAENGDPAGLLATLDGVAGVGATGSLAAGIGAGGDYVVGPLSYVAGAENFSFATMLAETNDGFIAMPGAGVALFQADGTPRGEVGITNDIEALIELWDAGTEENETPGLGDNTGVGQGAPAGLDEDGTIELYSDLTNDLDAEGLAGFHVTVTHNGGVVDILVQNEAPRTLDQAELTQPVWVIHDGSYSLFEDGMPASPGLEELAEDGLTPGLDQEIADGGISPENHGLALEEDPAGVSDPFFTFSVPADSANGFLTLATMFQPSNDTFLSLGPVGIALFDGGGAPLDGDYALVAWDAGTEQNQCGGAGGDMGGNSVGENVGANEGNGTVRLFSTDSFSDPVWTLPAPSEMIRVTVAPVPL